MTTLSLIRLTVLAIIPHSALLAQGLLTPPGAPAPTMKTLDQVEPRTPINATNTPGDATNSFRITAPGSYYLSGPVTGVAAKNGISVEASDVTIDLRGFTLAGVPGSLDGVNITAGNVRLRILNGTISAWGNDGVDEVDGSATDGIYENVHATGNGGDGLRLGDRCTITGCRLSNNYVFGLTANGQATIRTSTAIDNGADGFHFGAGSVLDSEASSNGDSGFESFGEPVLMKNCVAFDNADAGFRSGAGGKVADCISRQNAIGIDASYYGTVTNCTVKNNSWGIYAGGSCHIVGNYCEGNGNGIYTYDGRNQIDGNHALNGGTGINVGEPFVTSKNNLILRNTAGNNNLNYDIAADNRYGPIIDITAVGSPAVSGNSAADTTTTTHPWANFAY